MENVLYWQKSRRRSLDHRWIIDNWSNPSSAHTKNSIIRSIYRIYLVKTPGISIFTIHCRNNIIFHLNVWILLASEHVFSRLDLLRRSVTYWFVTIWNEKHEDFENILISEMYFSDKREGSIYIYIFSSCLWNKVEKFVRNLCFQ